MKVFKKRVDPPVLLSYYLHVFVLTELVRKVSPALLESAQVSNIQPRLHTLGFSLRPALSP